MPWWTWVVLLVSWGALTVIIAAYWWAPRWPEVKRELARDRAERPVRAETAEPVRSTAHRGD
jgi:hypothetical protein